MTIFTAQLSLPFTKERSDAGLVGRASGFTQTVERLAVDDDQDAVILFVKIEGPGSCHVGFRSCFYREIDLDGAAISRPARLRRIEVEPAFDAEAVYAGLPNPTKL